MMDVLMISKMLICFELLFLSVNFVSSQSVCELPDVIRGQWLSYEENQMRNTHIDSYSVSGLGQCHLMEGNHTHYRIILRNGNCYFCLQLWIRTLNVVEKRESGCISLRDAPSVDSVCQNIDSDRELITLFNENFSPKVCRSSIEGVWHFAYRDTFRSKAECNRRGNIIRSCQNAGDQFPVANQKFEMTYESCSNDQEYHSDFSAGRQEFACLGDWKVGKKHYFAVANTKESRLEERFRCFLKNRDDEFIIGKSITPECSVLKSPDDSPARLSISSVSSEAMTPGCRFPDNFTGLWVNTANADSDVEITQSRMVEIYRPDVGRVRSTTYTCLEEQDGRFMLARQDIFGCATDYVCYNFLSRHQNIIRYRRGREMSKPKFYTVCDWNQFEERKLDPQDSADDWVYKIMIAKELKTVACPVAGMFRFEQRGEVLFRTRILQGITEAPRPDLKCNVTGHELSACDQNRGQLSVITIDVDKCYAVDQQGLPLDIYSRPDHQMQCVGYWLENLKSYLITHEELDPISKFRCWVYQRIDEKHVKMSQSVGSYCSAQQTAQSSQYVDGVAVSLDLFVSERERDRCPLRVDEGENPWQADQSSNVIFRFDRSSSLLATSSALFSVCCALSLLTVMSLI